jgi:WS/DGAT/MGAT family acyltransferase
MRALVKILRAGPDADTAIRGELGVTQRIAETRPIDLEGVKRAGHATGTTVNDVVLTALSGALGSYLRERGTPAAEIRVFVPFDLRPPGAPIPRGLGNKFGPVLVPLPVGIREPQQRLAEVHRRMSEIKHSLDGGISYNLLRLIGLMPRQIGRRFIDFSTGKASGLITNVPGPPGSVSLAGAPVRGIVVWAPQPGITSMSVTTFSYNNEVIVTLGVDAGLIPDPERMVAGVENEIAELERLAPASTELRAA